MTANALGSQTLAGIGAGSGIAVGPSFRLGVGAGARDAAASRGVVIADELTPAQAAHLDPRQVVAVIAVRGSTTAHGVIVARAKGLPTVVGLSETILTIVDGTSLLVDGESGLVQLDPPEAAVRAAHTRREHELDQAAAVRRLAGEPAITRDGKRIQVFANVGSVAETVRAVAFGAEGVGMLRTEFLFLERDHLPGEDEQADSLREIAEVLDGRDLVVRTLDAGADKPLPALEMPPEDNPSLGVRGIRVGLLRQEVLATQLRAVLRVSAERPVKVMLPMIATRDELSAALQIFAGARAQTGIETPLELGMTVEVPATALNAARLARDVDFFSIGTNDLTQYTMAADRGESRLASLTAGPQPAVLQLVKATVDGASAAGRWVGICGELAGDPAGAVLLAGLGVTELSMSPVLIPEVKAALRRIDLEQAREVALAAIETDSADDARALALELI
jgi:phosphoenolpyruvate-protein phosphotransferase